MRKQLPKAILRPVGEPREFTADTAADEAAPGSVTSLRALVRRAVEADAAAPAIPLTPPAPTRSNTENDSTPAAASRASDPQAARRRKLAKRIVERHKMYAAMGGLFPVPIVNIAGVTAIIVRMVKMLCEVYGVPFDRDRTRALVIALMGGAVPTGLASAAASALMFVLPAPGYVGLAVSSVTAASLTRGIGLVFIERFESGDG